MKLTWKKLVFEFVAYSIAFALIVAAVSVSVTHLIEPTLNAHKQDFERIASRLLGRPLTIQKIYIKWEHFEPVIGLSEVDITDAVTHKPVFEIPDIIFNVRIWQSILNRQFLFDSLKVKGVHLTLQQTQAGFKLQGFGNFAVTDNFTGQPLNPSAMLAWIFSQPSLYLEDISLQFKTLNRSKFSISVHLLALKNTKDEHVLTGRATLNQEEPTDVNIDFKWLGDATDIATVRAKLFLKLTNVSLPQWFSQHTWRNLEILQGIGSTKVMASWNHNAWQNVETEMELYDIQAKSLLTKKNIIVSRFSGQLHWLRVGEHFAVQGSDLLIDLPGHVWPKDNFSLKYALSKDGVPMLQALKLDYLDLGDADDLIRASGLLPDNIAKWITQFDPEGEIHAVNVNYQGALSDISHISLAATFNHLSLNAWDGLPGVTNLRGQIAWNGQQGNLSLNSQEASIRLDKVFANPLLFDELSAQINWQQDGKQNWEIVAKSLHAANADANLTANASLTIPLNDSPSIQLQGDFNILNVEHVSLYLPLKIFEPDLVNWLQHAFLAGQVTGGKAVLAGRLSDFPFDHDSGKFIITGNVSNVDLHFAPDWPLLKKLKGVLTFNGRAMVAEIASGQLLDVPIQAVHAMIPYLGDDKPQFLDVTGTISAELEQGFAFIHQSPLEKTLGQQLAKMQLQGPMQLDLNLLIPLKHPGNTKVLGNVKMTHATLFFPFWNLTIDQVNGGFQFTDNGVTAKKITADLFSKPITLSLSTQLNKKNQAQVTALASGSVQISDLQKWLVLPFDQLLQGSAALQAQIILPPLRQSNVPTQIIVHSDLQGVQVNLPANYGKKAEDKTDFTLLMNVDVNQPLQLKIIDGNLLSVALTLKKQAEKMQLLSGDLHLGNVGTATWQSQPGILVSGNLATVNWSTLQPYLSQVMNKGSSGAQQNALWNPSMLRGADIVINQLILPTIQLNKIRIQITKNINALTIGLDNANLSGQIIWPLNLARNTVQARFQRLIVPTQLTSTKSTIDPSSLPAISFVGENIQYGAANLGRLTFNFVPNGKGITIPQFNIESAGMSLRASGYWQRAMTHLDGNLTISNMTKFLNSLGFGQASLVGTTGKVNFNLNWQGAPFQPSMATMTGDLSLTLGEGRIINLSQETNAEMGFGRMLNVFSLQSIPRRLSLNFNDLVDKGYVFDSLKGNFTFKNGSAYTTNTRLEGPVAGVALNGRLGIANKDYDLNLSVTPYVTSSLPVVLAAVNPVAGVAAWFVDKVVSSGVSNIITYRYKITGPWANPVWAKVGGEQQRAR